MYIYSRTAAGQLVVESKEPISQYQILNAAGEEVCCRMIDSVAIENGYRAIFDASALEMWTPDTPVLYTFNCPEEQVRFGYSSLRCEQNKMVLLNDAPIYLRGFIRGIVAHDHPNMTGESLYEAACKNIRQAKKYGFNLVRFHSTIPTPEFVRAADELGLLIHMEIGFAYEYNEKGEKTKLAMSNDAWTENLLRYRNCPSVAIFCIGNELHNSGRFPEVHSLYKIGRELAPSKLIMDNSGWGEYDRPTADIYSQHIAYFFPRGAHKDMFTEGEAWHMNGPVSGEPMKVSGELGCGSVKVAREPAAIRPVISHEAMHYISIPDYSALNKKFDEFAARVGEEYLKANGIKKPRYLTELPELIEKKGLTQRLPDYIAGSSEFRHMGMKVFLERMRLSGLCGYEMLQFSDCLKYENKNGIVDFFDDDKDIDPAWLRKMNADITLITDLETQTFYCDQALDISFYISDFLAKPCIRGDFTVCLDDEVLFSGKDFALGGGLQKLIGLHLDLNLEQKNQTKKLTAKYVSGDLVVENDWTLWFFARAAAETKPELALQNKALEAVLADNAPVEGVYMTDALNETVLEKLSAGKTVLLMYEYGAERNQWQMPGALERFKPCIWDRGSNLGGIIYNKALRDVLVTDRYFNLNMETLLEAGSKVNLDDVPFAVEEHVSGIDKPVRDRMKGLQHGIKHFIAEDTLRKFTHLFSVRVGEGLLIVCTFNVNNPAAPAVNAMLRLLVDQPEVFNTDKAISVAEYKAWLEDINSKPFRKEDVMNHFWEIDNKLVEDTLFWEAVEVDLTKLG